MKRFSVLSVLGLVLLNACSAERGMKKMEKNTEEMNSTTHDMNETTQDMAATTEEMNQKTTEMSEDTKEVREATEEMLEKTSEMSATTKEMQQSTQQVAEVTSAMARTTEGMAETTTRMAATTEGMAETTTHMAAITEGMAETTSQMAETTEDMHHEMQTMSAATAELRATSNDLRTATINLYDDNRQGAALEARNHSRQYMKTADDQLAKIGYAGQYFMAFEFQFWKGVYSDDAAKLDALKHDAIDEFIRTVYEFLPARRSVSPLSKAQSMKNLYALVATMHVVNSNGVLRAAAANAAADSTAAGVIADAADGAANVSVSVTDEAADVATAAAGDEALEVATPTRDERAPAGVPSILTLIEEGLAAKADLESGVALPENLKAYQKAVLEHEGVFVYLLQLRANFMTAMIAQLLATEDGQNLSLFGRVRNILFPWTAKTSVRNVAELAKFAELLRYAQSTQDFLASIGAPAPLDGTLRRFLKKIRFNEAELRSANPARAELVHALQDSVGRIVQ